MGVQVLDCDKALGALRAGVPEGKKKGGKRRLQVTAVRSECWCTGAAADRAVQQQHATTPIKG